MKATPEPRKAQKTEKKRFKRPAIRSDLLWKELLTHFFYESLEIFYPVLYAAADRNRKPHFLNTELRVPGIRKGQRIVDLLVDVPLVSGETAFVLFHCEVQGRGRSSSEPFHVRMYKYACLIALRFGRPFTTLAIRTTPREPGEQTAYISECFETRITTTYRTVYVDELDERELLSGTNPMGIAVAAAGRMLAAGRSEPKRLEYAKGLLRILRGRHYSMDETLRILQFIDGLSNLSLAELLAEFDREMDQLFKGVERMPIVRTPGLTRYFKKKSYEWGRNEGVAEGEAQGEARGEARGEAKGGRLKAIEMARKMLARGFEVDLIADLTELSKDEIESLR